MKNWKYLCMLGLTFVTFFNSCNKSKKEDNEDIGIDLREVLVGNYDVVTNARLIRSNPLGIDTTYETYLSDSATINKSDSFPSNRIELNGFYIGMPKIQAVLIDSNLAIDFNFFHRYSCIGMGTRSGDTVNLEFNYAYTHEIYHCTAVAIKRN
jgi:hypothetical protein